MARFRFVARRYEILLTVLAAVLSISVEVFSRCSSIDPSRLPAAATVITVPKPVSSVLKKTDGKLIPKTPAQSIAAVKYIALTFDDGPHPELTDKLLEVLRGEKVKATFFLVGQMIELYPNITRAMVQDGHQVANHTYSHPNLNMIDTEQLNDELSYTKYLLSSYGGVRTNIIRPPGGNYNSNVLKFCEVYGYKIVLWTIFPRDHESPKPGVIVKRVVKNAHDGGIILMHSGMKNTITALPEIIRKLKSEGYRFVTVDELIEKNQKNNVAKNAGKSGKLSYTAHLSQKTCLSTPWLLPAE
ncbi:MAG: polysaccharide deacetylase family protein [Elusimicrobiota bacterium]